MATELLEQLRACKYAEIYRDVPPRKRRALWMWAHGKSILEIAASLQVTPNRAYGFVADASEILGLTQLSCD